MSKDDFMAQALPRLELSDQDMKTILELSVCLLETNLMQQKQLQLTRDRFPDSRVWREVQRKDGIRVFKEFQPQNSMSSGNCPQADASHPDKSTMLSLLMLGTVAEASVRRVVPQQEQGERKEARLLRASYSSTRRATLDTMNIPWRSVLVL
ncbi:unnamed protein product [Peronospora destructor]|uniref:Uncharacterized protein n=1 Tax=Peronospora destructor TaxID=86335 RepID=A0AAV0TND2_9STRA|nr:unnamed protein product [Peronospora destructor]